MRFRAIARNFLTGTSYSDPAAQLGNNKLPVKAPPFGKGGSGGISEVRLTAKSPESPLFSKGTLPQPATGVPDTFSCDCPAARFLFDIHTGDFLLQILSDPVKGAY